MANGKRSPNRGCGFLFLTCLVTCVFLIFNVAFVTTFYSTIFRGSPIFGNLQVIQAVMYILPVMMVFVEWWIVDIVNRLFSKVSDNDEV